MQIPSGSCIRIPRLGFHFAHAVAASALGTAFKPKGAGRAFWPWAAFCAAVPDVDVIGFYLGVGHGPLLGHRGITHSLAFAAVLGALVTLRFDQEPSSRVRLWWFFFLATASHGVLDAMTNGGSGVAFLAPFDNTRYFFAFRPIEVSPLGVRPFFSARGAEVIASELVWVGVPSLFFVLSVWGIRRLCRVKR